MTERRGTLRLAPPIAASGYESDPGAAPHVAAAHARQPRTGDIIDNRYRLLDPLARGGHGIVYRAERLELGRIVAIKFLLVDHLDDDEHRSNFRREARAMSLLSHPHCVPIVDYGVHIAPYLVMDLIEGRTLADVLRDGPLPWERAVAIGRQLLAGLAHAHRHHLVHRDIKPGNIMLAEATGLDDHVRILDFGLARMREQAHDRDWSAPPEGWGTPPYMAPEQWRTQTVDARTDLYAVGIVLYEMLCGRRPFPGTDRAQLMKAHVHQPPPRIERSELHSAMPRGLESVLYRALQKSPRARFQSAQAFHAALTRVLRGADGRLNSDSFTLSIAADEPTHRISFKTTRTVAAVRLVFALVVVVVAALVAAQRPVGRRRTEAQGTRTLPSANAPLRPDRLASAPPGRARALQRPATRNRGSQRRPPRRQPQ